jgi:hypothetical protein
MPPKGLQAATQHAAAATHHRHVHHGGVPRCKRSVCCCAPRVSTADGVAEFRQQYLLSVLCGCSPGVAFPEIPQQRGTMQLRHTCTQCIHRTWMVVAVVAATWHYTLWWPPTSAHPKYRKTPGPRRIFGCMNWRSITDAVLMPVHWGGQIRLGMSAFTAHWPAWTMSC